MKPLPKEGWIAKDEDERVWLHPHKPELILSGNGLHYWACGSDAIFIGRCAFPDMNWKDKPKPCKIRIEFDN